MPIKNQPEFIEAALLAGKHVFAEKPVGPTAEAAKKQIDWYHSIADEKKVTWAIAEQVRFVPKFAWAAAEARKLGKVIGFHFKVFFHIGLGMLFYVILDFEITQLRVNRQQIPSHRMA